MKTFFENRLSVQQLQKLVSTVSLSKDFVVEVIKDAATTTLAGNKPKVVDILLDSIIEPCIRNGFEQIMGAALEGEAMLAQSNELKEFYAAQFNVAANDLLRVKVLSYAAFDSTFLGACYALGWIGDSKAGVSAKEKYHAVCDPFKKFEIPKWMQVEGAPTTVELTEIECATAVGMLSGLVSPEEALTSLLCLGIKKSGRGPVVLDEIASDFTQLDSILENGDMMTPEGQLAISQSVLAYGYIRGLGYNPIAKAA